jgi:hypothetical protein
MGFMERLRTSSAGLGFSSSASAFVDASNLGELRLSGSSSITGGGEAQAHTGIVITDAWTLSDPGLNGQTGTITVPILIEGSTTTSNNVLSAFDGQASTTWTFVVVLNGTSELFNVYNHVVQFDTESYGGSSQVNSVPGTTYGLLLFDIPFTFGTEFTMHIEFRGASSAIGEISSAEASASFDLANSIYWGGFSSVTVGGTTVSAYDFTSDSGFDWRRSSIPQNSVPEPASLVLVASALVALATRRVRKAPNTGRMTASPRAQ